VTQWLYRMFDAKDELLYIGISKSALRRISEHLETQPWVNEVRTVRFELHDVDRQTIRVIEHQAILAERPKHNVQHARAAGLTPNNRWFGKKTAPIPVSGCASQYAIRTFIVVGQVVGLAMRGQPTCWVGHLVDASDTTVTLDLYQWSTGTFGYERRKFAVADVQEAFVAGRLSNRQKALRGIDVKDEVLDMDAVADYQRLWKDIFK